MTQKFDTIQKAKHYNLHPSGVECKDIARHLGFDLGNACKYLWRMHEKHDEPLQDLEKALFYIDDYIESLKTMDGFRVQQLPHSGTEGRKQYDYDVRSVIAKETNGAALAFWCLVLPDPTVLKNVETARSVLITHIEVARKLPPVPKTVGKEDFR